MVHERDSTPGASSDPLAWPLLAFDTSTEVLAVAAGGPTGVSTWNGRGGAAASAQLVPQLHAALARCGLALGDVQAVAFGRGPGAFTGLRTSCAVAQGLGLGLARPLLPLDSLLVVAEDALAAQAAGTGATARVAVAMDARMDEIYGAVYEWQGRRAPPGPPGPPGLQARPAGPEGQGASDGRWVTRHEPALHTLEHWNAVLEREAASAPPPLVLAGSAVAAFGARLHRPAGIAVAAPEHDRAAALLRLAARAFAAGQGIDAALALPLYLRDKVALTTAERAAARAADAAAGAGA